MKLVLRSSPEDFQVTEEIALTCSEGPYALYRVEKRGLGTPEVVAALAKKWHLRADQIAWAGFKDRHAVATQYITVLGGPRRSFQQPHINVHYLGQTSRAIRSEDIVRNHFRIVIRRLTPQRVECLQRRLDIAQQRGWPNYFDEQRFGSVGFPGEYVAESWCLGDYQRALWLALASPYRYDSSQERVERQWLRFAWGDWSNIYPLVRHPVRRSVAKYLATHPGDFRRAFALIPVTLRRIYLSAFQSFLWNVLASSWLEQHLAPGTTRRVKVADQELVVPHWGDVVIPDDFFQQAIPLPSARTTVDDARLASQLDKLLAERGLERRQLRVKYPRDAFFSKGARALWIRAFSLEHRVELDALHPGRRALVLECRLPRGTFASFLLRYISADDHGSTKSLSQKTGGGR